MPNRREFLQAAACALPAASVKSAATAIAPAEFHAVLVDPRIAPAVSFGQQIARHGARVLSPTENDLAALWMEEIRPAWMTGHASIAGLTASPALFCLEQLAWQHGLRVVFHAEHVLLAGGHVEHELLRGARAARLTQTGLRLAGPAWPARLADALSARLDARGLRREGPSLAALEPALPEGAQLLVSWIIAAA